MSDWPNPALKSEKLKPRFTVVSWCLNDAKNTCKICPCLWNGTPNYYTQIAQPCGPPFVALASRAEGIKCQTHGEYHEIVGPEHWNDPIVPIYSAPIAVQPIHVAIQVYKNSGKGWTLVETIPWFDLGPGTETSFSGYKKVDFYVGPPSHPVIIETFLGSYWSSEQIIDPFDLILASPDAPYPNGTYDMIYSDLTGVYDHYTAWVEGPIPDDFPKVLTQYYLAIEGGYYSAPSGITIGPSNWQTNFSGTQTSDVAVYGRVECSYAHENAGIPPYPPLPN
jgi:hypothetical protein